MMPGIFSFMREILADSREILSLSDTYGYTPTGLQSSTTSQLQLHLPEVLAPAQYLIDVGLQPAVARRLSSTYMDYVDRYRTTCQSHFDRVTQGGHITGYYHKVFIILFKRSVRAWNSQIVSIVRAKLCQAGVHQVTIRPGRVDIRVDDAAKAEIIARLGLKVTHLASDGMATSLNPEVTSRLEEVSKQTHVLSADAVNSRLMLLESPPTSSTWGRSDPFSRVAPQTCFPAPYPPPPAPCLPRSALPTSFIPPQPPRDVRSLGSHCLDVSTLINLFGRMTTSTLETESKIPRNDRVFCIHDSNRIKPLSPVLSPNVADNSTKPQLASVESVTSPTRSTNTTRRRKIASLPTRWGKTSASPSPPVFHSAGATSYPITPRPTERVVEETPCHDFAEPQKTCHVPTLPSQYTAEASCGSTLKSSTLRQRKVHVLRKTQTIRQNQAAVSRSPPLVSDSTSYFDSPPTSSDELDTPPSTPPSSHVFLASTSTESLVTSSESDRIVSHKEPLGDAKLVYPRQRYRRLDFTKGGLGRNEQPLTFTFSV